MSEPVTIQLDAPIRRVTVVGAETEETDAVRLAERRLAQQQAELDRRAKALEQQGAARQAELERSAQALRGAAKELAALREEMIRELRAAVPVLAMDIARKVLQQEIESREYQIDPIVEAALSRLPKRGEILVCLHPDDFERCGLARGGSAEESVRFAADPSVPPGGCRIESGEGTVESDPAAALEQIEKTLRENA